MAENHIVIMVMNIRKPYSYHENEIRESPEKRNRV